MPQATAVPQSADLSHYLGSDKAAVPIDLDWRKKYYKKVLRKRMIAFVLDYFITFVLSTIGAVIIAEEVLHIGMGGIGIGDYSYCNFFALFCFALLWNPQDGRALLASIS